MPAKPELFEKTIRRVFAATMKRLRLIQGVLLQALAHAWLLACVRVADARPHFILRIILTADVAKARATLANSRAGGRADDRYLRTVFPNGVS